MSAGAFIVVIVLLELSEYILGQLFINVTDVVFKFSGGLSLVIFMIFLIQLIIKSNYFNDTIFYKQALSGLQKAQDLIEDKNVALKATDKGSLERNLLVLNDKQWSEFNCVLDTELQDSQHH